MRTGVITGLVLAAAATAAATDARADHHHGGPHPAAEDDGDHVVAAVGLVAARYRSPLYAGDYQGVDLGVRWERRWLAIAARLPAFRLEKNGAAVHGIGDLMIHGDATMSLGGRVTGGLELGGSLPTGDDLDGLGMGHLMVMASARVTWAGNTLALSAAAGYARALASATTHAEHGAPMWPLVDPMNVSEVTFGGDAAVTLAPALRVGVQLAGAIPVPSDDGVRRATGGVSTTLITGRFATTAAIEAGLAGAPFELRGSITTSYRFR